MRNICVFCGSSPGSRPSYTEVARKLGEHLASQGITLVYGGARVGLMGVVADAALSKGGRVVGILPGFMEGKEIAHPGLTELIIVKSMHERKAQMAERSDAFIAMPGGYGTFEELFEMLTWTQLGLQQKPCGLLNVEGYYAPLCAQLDRAVIDGFMRSQHREMLLLEDDGPHLVRRLGEWQPKPTHKWITRNQT